MDYDKLREIASDMMETQSMKNLANTTIDVHEKLGTDIDEVVKILAVIKVKDTDLKENYLKNKDIESIGLDKIISSYENDMNKKGYYLESNYNPKSILFKNFKKYLEDNNVNFKVGKSFDIFGNETKWDIGIYIKDFNKPYDEAKELHDILNAKPRLIFKTDEEFSAFLKEEIEAYKRD